MTFMAVGFTTWVDIPWYSANLGGFSWWFFMGISLKNQGDIKSDAGGYQPYQPYINQHGSHPSGIGFVMKNHGFWSYSVGLEKTWCVQIWDNMGQRANSLEVCFFNSNIAGKLMLCSTKDALPARDSKMLRSLALAPAGARRSFPRPRLTNCLDILEFLPQAPRKEGQSHWVSSHDSSVGLLAPWQCKLGLSNGPS